MSGREDSSPPVTAGAVLNPPSGRGAVADEIAVDDLGILIFSQRLRVFVVSVVGSLPKCSLLVLSLIGYRLRCCLCSYATRNW